MDYKRAAKTADRLLQANGRACTFTRRTGGAYNATTGASQLGRAETFPGTVVTLEFSARQVDGTNIQTGDLRGLASAAGKAPQVGDTLTLDAIVYRVIDPRPLNPGGTVLLYYMQLRRV